MEQRDRAERATPPLRSTSSVGTHADPADATGDSDGSLAVPEVAVSRVVRSSQTATTCELRVLTTAAELVASNTMIGTLRLITQEPQDDYEYLINYVLTELSDHALTEQALGPRPRALPA